MGGCSATSTPMRPRLHHETARSSPGSSRPTFRGRPRFRLTRLPSRPAQGPEGAHADRAIFARNPRAASVNLCGGPGSARPCARPPPAHAAPWCARPSAPPPTAPAVHAGGLPTAPALPVTFSRLPNGPRGAGPSGWRGSASRRVSSLSGPALKPTSRCDASLPRPSLFSGAGALHPHGAPSRGRWRSPASLIVLRASPPERGGSPRARTRPPASRATSPRACPLRLSLRSLSPASFFSFGANFRLVALGS